MESTVASSAHLAGILTYILIFFGIAGVVVPLLQHLKISPVLGYLICGVIIGPFGLASLKDQFEWLHYFTITEVETAYMLGELGIITLMFMIGLELSLERLQKLKKYIFGLGTAQILTTAIVIFLVAAWFGNTIESAILLGASLALSSTAIVMKLLEEHDLQKKPIGTLCFSILLMQDLAVVPILVIAASFSGTGTENILQTLLTSLVIGLITVSALIFFGRQIISPLFAMVRVAKNTEWLAAFVVFIVIAFAAITQAVGLSLALGAFLAGTLIAETEYKDDVEEIVNPIKGMLLGIFFLSVGMMINVEEIFKTPFLLAISVAGIFILKAAIIFPLCLFFKVPKEQSAQAAVYLAQPGEFALLILGVALAGKLMSPENVQFFLLVTVLAMMLTPLIFKLAPLAGRMASKHGKTA